MDESRNTWMAMATKIGGQLVWIGGEFTEGTMVNLANTHWRFDFQINSFRTGPGLGMSAGYVVVFFFNCPSPWVIHETKFEDWGFNLAVLGKWKDILKAVKNAKLYTTAGRIGVHMAMGLHEADTMRNAAHTISTGLDIKNRGGKPTIISLDLPLGVGVELSWVDIYGTVKIMENQSVPTPQR
jgi:hypothetical protein